MTDVDSTNLASATVSISTGHFTGDTLAATTTGTLITAAYNATSGVLTLSGSDTVAHYQQVLNSVTYSSSSADPTNAGTDTDAHLELAGDRRHLGQHHRDEQSRHRAAATTGIPPAAADDDGQSPPPPPMMMMGTSPPPPPFSPPFTGNNEFAPPPDQPPGFTSPPPPPPAPVYVVFDTPQFSDEFHNFVDQLTQFLDTAGTGSLFTANFDLPVADRAFTGHFDFTLPAVATWLDASLTSGNPLPSWLHFDPVSGRFFGTPPAGFSGTLNVEVDAINADGKAVELILNITIGSPSADAGGRAGSAAALLQAPADNSVAGAAMPLEKGIWLTRHGDGVTVERHAALPGQPAANDREGALGKTALTDQLKAAGWHGLLLERSALLDSLRVPRAML